MKRKHTHLSGRFNMLIYFTAAMMMFIINADRSAYGQRIELYGGGNISRLWFGESASSDSYYHTSPGYTAGAGIANLRVARIPLRVTLQLEKNKSEFYQRSGGMGGGYTISAESERTLMTAGFYPLNFRFAKHLLIHLGIEYSYLITSKSEVIEHSYSMNATTPSKKRYNEVNIDRNFGFGFAAEAAWHILLKEHLFIAPWFRAVISTTDPFVNTLYQTRMAKAHGGISVIRRLGFD